MNNVRRSVFFSALDKYAQQILLIVTTAVMARILTPAETGLYLLANSVILLADNLRTFGVGIYIVKVRELDRAVLRATFTVTLLLSALIMPSFIAAAEPVASFYQEPELAPLLRLSALAFLFVPFATPIVALLQRELAFRQLALINIAVALTNAGTTIALGLAGAGPASFIWGFVAGSVTLAILAFVARPSPDMFRPTLAGARAIVSFGSLSSAVTVINMAYELLPRLVLGKILGFDAVGLYARAITICQIPERTVTSALSPVVLPAMAAHTRNGGALKESYLQGHRLMSGVQWPMLVMLALLADPVVHVILGSQWSAAAPLVRLLCLGMLALAPAFMTFPVLVTAGRTRDCLFASLISLPPSVAIIAFAASFGVTAVAASSLAIAPLQMTVAFLFIRRAIALSWREFLRDSRKSVVIALATALLPSAVVLSSPTGFTLGAVETVVAILSGAAGWLTSVWLTSHPLKAEISRILSALSAIGRRSMAVSVQTE